MVALVMVRGRLWGWRGGAVRFRGLIAREVEVGVLFHGVNDLVADAVIFRVWEEAARNVLGEALFSVIRVIDGHFKDGFLEPLEFFVGMSLDHQGLPSLEADGREAGDVRPFVDVVRLLNEMMLDVKLPVHPGN